MRRDVDARLGRLYWLVGILVVGSVSVPQTVASSRQEEALELEQVVLIATDPAEHRAVLRVGDDELRLLAPGESIAGTNATVEQILADRLVVIETVGDPARRRVAWIYPRDRAAGVPHIRYLEGRAPTAGSPAQLPTSLLAVDGTEAPEALTGQATSAMPQENAGSDERDTRGDG